MLSPQVRCGRGKRIPVTTLIPVATVTGKHVEVRVIGSLGSWVSEIPLCSDPPWDVRMTVFKIVPGGMAGPETNEEQ